MFIKNFLKRKSKKSHPTVTNDEVYAGVINTLKEEDIRILVDLSIKMGLNVPKELQEEMRQRAQKRINNNVLIIFKTKELVKFNQ